MKEDLARLMEAQKYDLEIDKLMKYKVEYPRQMEALKKEIIDLEKTLEDIKADIVKKETNRRTIESEIIAERDLLAQKDKRLLETKTNKEYTAVQHEIEMARERIDSLETEDLELMTALDELGPKRSELEKLFKETKKANKEKIADTEMKFKSIESDIKVLEKKRDRALTDINKRALSVYKRLRQGRDGLAVSTVDPVKYSCRGCFKQLPPQKVVEIRRGDKLIFCENCGRILMWDTDNV